MAIKQFDKKNLEVLRNDMNAALAAVAEKHGVTLHAGNATFMGETVTFKLEAVVLDKDGNVQTKESVALKQHYPEYVGKKVKFSKGNGIVIGVNTRARKNPFLVKVGKNVWMLPEDMIE